MEGLITLLGTLLIALTLIGSYRLATYLAPDNGTALYPALIATTLTTAFIVIVDVVILLTGLLVFLLPVLYLRRNPDLDLTGIPDRVRQQLTDWQDRLHLPDWLHRYWHRHQDHVQDIDFQPPEDR